MAKKDKKYGENGKAGKKRNETEKHRKKQAGRKSMHNYHWLRKLAGLL